MSRSWIVISDFFKGILKLLFLIFIDIVIRLKTLINQCQGQSRKSIQKIAILYCGGIGDYINYLPTLRIVRQTLPQAHLTVIAYTYGASVKDILSSEVDSVLEIKNDKPSLKHCHSEDFDLMLIGYRDANLHTLLIPAFSRIPFIIYTREKYYRQWLVALKKLFRVPYTLQKTYIAQENATATRSLLAFLQKPYPPGYKHTPQFHTHPNEKAEALQFLSKNYPGFNMADKKIFIHPGSSTFGKNRGWLRSWSIKNWQILLSELVIRYPKASIVLLGGPDDEEVMNALTTHISCMPDNVKNRIINLHGKIPSLQKLAAFISLADLLVCCDSAPMHFSVALGVRLVAIFAGTNENAWLPKDDRFLVAARQDLSCRPCLWVTRTHCCDNPVCLDVPVEMVLEKIDYQLHRYVSQQAA